MIVRSAVIAGLLACAPITADAADGDSVALRWNAVALEAIRQSTLPPPAVARALAILHTCMYDAWAAYHPIAAGVHYHRKLNASDEEVVARAISVAAHRALVDLFPNQHARFDAFLLELGYDPLDDTPEHVLGREAADAGLNARRDDGANQEAEYADVTGYVPVNSPEAVVDPFRWQPLRMPDGTVQQFALPHWGRVAPFALDSPDRLRPPAPVVFPQGLYRKQAMEILHLSARLTDRQKVIAWYWADGPGTETPPGHWCLLAAFVSRRDGHTLEQDVKLFFALSNALMDAGIAAWEAKRHYDYVRPVTAIRVLFAGQPVRAWAGPFQGTRLIPGDTWRSYIATPPFPDHVSGHSAFSAASAEILRSFTGSDRFGAEVTVPAGALPLEPGLVPRTDISLVWGTFSEAADEAGMSRRYGGIHFEAADLDARALGRQVGRLVWQEAQAYFTGVR